MVRIAWIVGTLLVGSAVTVGVWFASHAVQRDAQAELPAPATDGIGGSQLALAGPATQTELAQTKPDAVAGEPTTEQSGDSLIGSLRGVLESAPQISPEQQQQSKDLAQAEAALEAIKRENRSLRERMERRAPLAGAMSPNIVLVDLPGLGYADIAAYHPQQSAHSNIDRLAREGLIFTHFYASSSRPVANTCSLLTGWHNGRARLRDNEPVHPLALDDVTTAEMLWRAGYATFAAGQWRLGGAGTSGSPLRQGFEEAWFTNPDSQNELPPVWHGKQQVASDEQPNSQADFQLACIDRALAFVESHRSRPVFIYLSFPLDKLTNDERDAVDEQIGRLADELRRFKLPRPGYVFITGSPGKNVPPLELTSAVEEVLPAEASAPAGPAPADSTAEGTAAQTVAVSPAPAPSAAEKAAVAVAGLRGDGESLYEGGLRAPLIVWTPQKVLGGERADLAAAWDLMPTMGGLSYAQFLPSHINGVSLADRLQVYGEQNTPLHPVLYWELHGDSFVQALLSAKWKLIRSGDSGAVELYNLENDPTESHDVSQQQASLVEKLLPLFDQMRSESRNWPRTGQAQAKPEVNR